MSTRLVQENLIKSKTHRPLEEVCARVEAACAQQDFSVLSQIDLAQKMRSKGVGFKGECRVYEFCNPGSAAEALSDNRDIAALLPCRIAIYNEEEGGETYISSATPTSLLGLFGASKLTELAERMEDSVRAVVMTLASGES